MASGHAVDFAKLADEAAQFVGQRPEIPPPRRGAKNPATIRSMTGTTEVSLWWARKISDSQVEPSFHSPSDIRQKMRPGSPRSRLPRPSPADRPRP